MNYLLLTGGGEPECYDEACQSEDACKWELSMKEKMKTLIPNQTRELAKLPEGKKALHNKWVYQGINYTYIFAPVVKLNTIITILNIVASEDLHLEQLDVKTAFLHGDLDEEIYMHQP